MATLLCLPLRFLFFKGTSMQFSDSTLWMIAGAVLIVIETTMMPGIGFLFAGLGAITTGALMLAGMAQADTGQWTWFFASTALWTVVLWVPLRNFYNRSSSGYEDMHGQVVRTLEGGIKKGEITKVKYSGSFMNARLTDDSPTDFIPAGKELEIIKVEKGILIVRPKL